MKARLFCARLSNHPYFTHTIIGLILLNAALLGLETNESWKNSYASWFHLADMLLLSIFILEIIIRMLGSRPLIHFFKNGWNVFDFLIVTSSLLFAGGQFIVIFRILRILRTLRTFSVIPSLRRMVNALFMTIPALGNILLLMGLVFYIFGVTGTMIFADMAPEYFGTLPRSWLTLFQIVTLDSWASSVLRPLLETSPWAWLYFVLFVLMGTFIIFNLFVGAIVNSMDKAEQEAKDQNASKHASDKNEEILQEMENVRAEIGELKQLLLASKSNKQ